MKTTGFLIFTLGLLITIFTGLTYVTREVMIDTGDAGLMRGPDPAVSWLPLVGVAVMIAGAAFFFAGTRRHRSQPKL